MVLCVYVLLYTRTSFVRFSADPNNPVENQALDHNTVHNTERLFSFLRFSSCSWKNLLYSNV